MDLVLAHNDGKLEQRFSDGGKDSWGALKDFETF
jgi:hypothetical protein